MITLTQVEADEIIRIHQIWLADVDKMPAIAIPNTLRAAFDATDISGLDFSGKDLRYAYFAEAKAVGTKFVGAKLAHTDFYLAVLDNADFQDANLEYADFEAAVLNRTNFSGATMVGTKFMHTLDTVKAANFENAKWV